MGRKRFNTTKDRTLECFEKVTFAGNRMMILLNNLLDLSKLEAGKKEYNYQENDFLEIVNEEVSKIIPQLETKGISVVIDKPNVITTCICDSDVIAQVIQNLLSNSIKFSEDSKKIKISFDSKHLPPGKILTDNSIIPALLVSVRDEGFGIPADELESIFDKFIQSSKTNTGAGGTGLGLSICREIIEGHHGKIWAENNPEGGATFNVMLPYEQEVD